MILNEPCGSAWDRTLSGSIYTLSGSIFYSTFSGSIFFLWNLSREYIVVLQKFKTRNFLNPTYSLIRIYSRKFLIVIMKP